MGVPAFFRWLSRKYPSIVVNAVEERRTVGDVDLPVDSTQPNPNFQEFDNLYLDMNGIIHPCTHPEDRPAPKNEEEMFMLIFDYIDRLFAIVRPRKLLYMAIDGVAPRAKMNQQRSRRFRASKEAAEKQEEILSVRNDLESKGIPLPPPKPKEEHFDSNCITPGTPFMARLAVALRYYVHLRITNDPAWQNILVILSDANVPGEGEHKIMDFIRRQRLSPEHNPNIVHCLCGADADLIMLGLATHEVNFNILREEFLPNRPRPCELCFQYGHELKNCQGLLSKDDNPDLADVSSKQTNFIFIRLPVLREYLERDLFIPRLPFKYDFERAIDDWVFMCFFVGNDFLPHLPSLEIREGAIDRLIGLYKTVVHNTQGWLTDNGIVFVKRVEMIMEELGKVEDETFRTRQERELRFRANQRRRRQQENRTQKPAFLPQSSSVIVPHALNKNRGSLPYVSGAEVRQQLADQRRVGMQTEQAQQILSELFTPVGGKKRGYDDDSRDGPKAKLFKSGHLEKEESWREISRDSKSINAASSAAANSGTMEEDEAEPEDTIRLWEDGWKDRYYKQKFGVSETDVEFRRKVAWAYTEGLCWVLKYYYQGCVSWDWYYPYHYAPFASDFDNISEFKPDWSKKTKPFFPLEQLMGVFPAASKLHIPVGWRNLMTSPESPIFQFYPTEFKVDLNGKKFAWQGVALLPFVDEKLLLKTLESFYNTLTDEEKSRNVVGFEFLFAGKRHPVFDTLQTVYEMDNNQTDEPNDRDKSLTKWISIDPSLTDGMTGDISFEASAHKVGACYYTLFPCSEKYKDIRVNNCIMVAFKNPHNKSDEQFFTGRLIGSKTPERVLKPTDWDQKRNDRFRPTIGFSNNNTTANLSEAGHRMLRHEVFGKERSARQNNAPYKNRNRNDMHSERNQHSRHGEQHTFYNKNRSQHNNFRPQDPRRSHHQATRSRASGQVPMMSFQQLALYGAPPPPPNFYSQPPPPPPYHRSAHQFDSNAQPFYPNNNGQRQQQQHDNRPANRTISEVPANIYGAQPNNYGGYQGFWSG